MLGSDAMAMINKTNIFYEIEDKEFLKITKDNIEIYTIYGNKVTRDPYQADIDASDIEKGTYSHYMMKEIEEQPFVIRKIMSEYSDENGNMCIDQKIIDDVRNCDKLYIIACGTSYHAGLIGKQFLKRLQSNLQKLL